MIDTQAIRNKILLLALNGQLVRQDTSDTPAFELVSHLSEDLNGQPYNDVVPAEEIPYDIPNTWVWCRLADIGTTNIGLTYHPEDVSAEGTIVARSSNILNGRMDYSDLVRVVCPIRENQYLNKNDILICARNGSKALVGKCAIYEGEPKTVAFGAFMAVYRTPLFHYVYYYFNTPVFKRNFASDDSKQINQVTQAILKQSLIPLPPFAEQKRIVEKIEQAFSVLDTIDELQKKYADNMTVLKSKLIDLAIRGKLTEQRPEDGTAEELYKQIQIKRKELEEKKVIKSQTVKNTSDDIPFEIPESWKWIRIGSIEEINLGFTYRPEYVSEGVYFLSVKDISDGKICFENAKKVSIETYYNAAYGSKPQKGDILFGRVGTMGKPQIVDTDIPFCIFVSLGFFRDHLDIINKKYVTYWMQSKLFDDQVELNVAGVAQRNLNTGWLKNFYFPLPPLAEQKRIVALLDNIMVLFEQ